MSTAMLTTIDNPYSPFTHWDEWFAYDLSAGYNTSGFLARIANVSHELSETDFNLAIDKAIDEIVRENVLGIYLKVTKEYFEEKNNLEKNNLEKK